MTKKTYTKPRFTKIGHIPIEFTEAVLNRTQSAQVLLDYWVVYIEIQKLRKEHGVIESFIKLGIRMDKGERTIELYYYRAKKIIDSLNIEI